MAKIIGVFGVLWVMAYVVYSLMTSMTPAGKVRLVQRLAVSAALAAIAFGILSTIVFAF